MKLSGVTFFWECAKNFKLNLELALILILNSKAL